MAAEAKVILAVSMTGLGKTIEFPEAFVTTTAPTAKSEIYQAQTTTNVAEALTLGGVITPHLIVIKAVDNRVSIDTSFVTTFSAELDVQEGEVAIFKPSGAVYIKNFTAGEKVVVEALIAGV